MVVLLIEFNYLIRKRYWLHWMTSSRILATMTEMGEPILGVICRALGSFF